MSISTPRQTGAPRSKRKPPPQQNRFRQGQSGNPAGRPKGAISLAGIARKFAFKTVPVTLGGKRQRLMRFDVIVLKLTALAADGSAAAAEELAKLRLLLTPRTADHPPRYLLVPAELPLEEYIAQEKERDKDKVEPGTAINLDAEEFSKAARGEPTVYGQALLAHHRKYRGLHD